MTTNDITEQLIISDFNGGFQPELVRFDLVNRLESKPKKALWSSTLHDGTSEWEQWCFYEEPEWIEGVEHWVFVPKTDTKVFTVDSVEDAKKLPIISIGFSSRLIDFRKLAGDGFDGLHLTSKGAQDLHWGVKGLGFDFNSWDVESTVWFNTRWIQSIHRLDENH